MQYPLLFKGLFIIYWLLVSTFFLAAQEDTLPRLKLKEVYENKEQIYYVKYDEYGRPTEESYKRVKEEYTEVKVSRSYFSNPDTFSIDYMETRPYDLDTYIKGMKTYQSKEVSYNHQSAFLINTTNTYDQLGRLVNSYIQMEEDREQAKEEKGKRWIPDTYEEEALRYLVWQEKEALKPYIKVVYNDFSRKRELSYTVHKYGDNAQYIYKKETKKQGKRIIETVYEFLDTTNSTTSLSVEFKDIKSVPFVWLSTKKTSYTVNGQLEKEEWKDKEGITKKLYEYKDSLLCLEMYFKKDTLQEAKNYTYNKNKQLIRQTLYSLKRKENWVYPQKVKYYYYHPVWQKIVQYREASIDAQTANLEKIEWTKKIRKALAPPAVVTAKWIKLVQSANNRKSILAWEAFLADPTIAQPVKQNQATSIGINRPLSYLLFASSSKEGKMNWYYNPIDAYILHYAYDATGQVIYKEQDYGSFINIEKKKNYKWRDTSFHYEESLEYNIAGNNIFDVTGNASLEKKVEEQTVLYEVQVIDSSLSFGSILKEQPKITKEKTREEKYKEYLNTIKVEENIYRREINGVIEQYHFYD